MAEGIDNAGHVGGGGGGFRGSSSGIQLSNSTIPDTTSSGSTVGTLSVPGTTGTPVFTLSSNPGGLFSITGNSLLTAAALSAGSYPITVHVTGVTPAVPDKAFLINVTHVGANSGQPMGLLLSLTYP